jgi:hypothetical protein
MMLAGRVPLNLFSGANLPQCRKWITVPTGRTMATYKLLIAGIDERNEGNLPVRKFRPTLLRHSAVRMTRSGHKEVCVPSVFSAHKIRLKWSTGRSHVQLPVCCAARHGTQQQLRATACSPTSACDERTSYGAHAAA